MRLSASIFILLAARICFGQSDDLSAERQRLSFIQGSWTIDGMETTYVEVCDWIQGNHLQCVANSTADKADNSISYFSYSPSEKVYVYYGLYGGGGSRTLLGQWVEDRFVFEGQRQTAIKLTKWRVTMKPAEGNIDFLEEHKVNDGDWEEVARFQYKPVTK